MSSFPETAVCLHCGYALRGLPENVCPECGGGFDPDDAASFSMPRQSWRAGVRRRILELATPPCNEELGFSILASLAILVPLWFSPVPTLFAKGEAGNLAKIIGIPPLVVTCGYSLVHYLCVRLHRKQTGQLAGRWRLWVAPLALTISLAACVTSWPYRLRFQISLPFIEATAARMRAQHVDAIEQGLIGLFGVDRLVVHGDGRIRLILREWSHGRSGQTELSFEPNGRRGSAHTYVMPFGGDWHLRQWGRGD